MEQEILIAEDVAKMLRIDKQRVYELARSNSIPVIRLGDRQYRFSFTAITKWLNEGGSKKGGDIDNERNK
jgi:excisionase family DNA binding protein